MLVITKHDKHNVARFGSAACVLPILERTDSETGQTIMEAVSASGIRGLFRKAVHVQYDPVRSSRGDCVVTAWVPRHVVYDRVESLLMKLAQDNFAGWLVKISRMVNACEASDQLEGFMAKVTNLLSKESWSPHESTSFEVLANSEQAILLQGRLPSIKGRFLAEVDAHRRLEAAKALMNAGLLTSPCATGTGDPGRSYYLSHRDGYSLTELTNPLVSEMPEKRRGVVNAAKNCVEIVGAQQSPVHIKGVDRTPPMVNAVVVCLPLALDDSVIISESLAERLTAKTRRSKYHNIDGVINHRGGLRPTGRNGALVKRACEWPLRLDRTEDVDGHAVFTTRKTGLNQTCQPR